MPHKETNFREDVGARLRRVREALDLDQGQVASLLGVVANAVSQYEKGRRMLDPEMACRLRSQWGVPTDYFYAGDVTRLPADLASEIPTDPANSKTAVVALSRAKKRAKK